MSRLVRAKNTIWNNIISNVERTSNIAKVTTSSAHNFSADDLVTVDCDDNAYDVSRKRITVGSTTTFSYDNTGSNEAQKSASGYVGVTKNYAGQDVDPNAYYDLDLATDVREDKRWGDDTNVLTAIDTGDILINNGVDTTDDIVNNTKAKKILRATSGFRIQRLSFGFPDYRTRNPFWSLAGRFVFDGTDYLADAITMQTICSVATSSTVGRIRIYDITNVTEIAQTANITNTDIAIINLGTITNLPKEKTIFEIQFKKISGPQSLLISGFEMLVEED